MASGTKRELHDFFFEVQKNFRSRKGNAIDGIERRCRLDIYATHRLKTGRLRPAVFEFSKISGSAKFLYSKRERLSPRFLGLEVLTYKNGNRACVQAIKEKNLYLQSRIVNKRN